MLFLLLLIFGLPAECRFKSWHFSPEFLAQYKPQGLSEAMPFTCAPAHSPSYQSTSNIFDKPIPQASPYSYENAQRLVNIATIIFATIQIYERYQTIGATEPNMHEYQWLVSIKKFIASLCPDMLQSVGVYGFFLVDSTAIVFKALVYKAIAKLLLLCAYGDISDLIGSITHGGIHAAKVML